MKNLHKLFPEGLRAFVAFLIYPQAREQRDLLRRETEIDPMTMCANRRAFDRAKLRAEVDHEQFIFFDIGNLKAYQDTLGHEAGDEAIIRAALAIQKAASEYNHGCRVFRYGGDEFVVIAPPSVAASIRDIAEAEFGLKVVGEVPVFLTGGIGYNLESADRQMYFRKRGFKGAFAVSLAPELEADHV